MRRECRALQHAGEGVRASGLESLHDLDTPESACLVESRCVPLGVIDLGDIVQGGASRAWIRTGPHQEADPLQTSLLTELA